MMENRACWNKGWGGGARRFNRDKITSNGTCLLGPALRRRQWRRKMYAASWRQPKRDVTLARLTGLHAPLLSAIRLRDWVNSTGFCYRSVGPISLRQME